MAVEHIVGVIDLGSNSVSMTITQISAAQGDRTIARLRKLVRLSEGMQSDGILREPAMSRTIEALKDFRAAADEYRCTTVAPIATAAVRAAANREQFLERVRQKTGFDFTVIDGQKECYYDYLAVAGTLDVKDGLVLDIGGGSFEIVLIKDGTMARSASIPYGAVTLAEKFASVPHSRMYRFVMNAIGAVEWIDEACGMNIYGVGGSLRAFARIYLRDENIPTPELHGCTISSSSASRVYRRIFETPPDKRKKIKGLGEGREDIILAGITPFKVLSDMLSSPRLIISANGLREGVLIRLKNELAQGRF